MLTLGKPSSERPSCEAGTLSVSVVGLRVVGLWRPDGTQRQHHVAADGVRAGLSFTARDSSGGRRVRGQSVLAHPGEILETIRAVVVRGDVGSHRARVDSGDWHASQRRAALVTVRSSANAAVGTGQAHAAAAAGSDGGETANATSLLAGGDDSVRLADRGDIAVGAQAAGLGDGGVPGDVERLVAVPGRLADPQLRARLGAGGRSGVDTQAVSVAADQRLLGHLVRYRPSLVSRQAIVAVIGFRWTDGCRTRQRLAEAELLARSQHRLRLRGGR